MSCMKLVCSNYDYDHAQTTQTSAFALYALLLLHTSVLQTAGKLPTLLFVQAK